jgi:predicted lipoprotein
MKPSSLRWVAIIAIGAPLASCFHQPFDNQAMLESLGSDVIIPTYASFAEQSAALVRSAGAFCEDPASSLLKDLQSRWQQARVTWKQMEAIDFGPYEDQPWRLGPKIDSWPVRQETVEQNLAGDEPLSFERVRALGASSRGLPVMEYLIFDPEGVDVALSKFEEVNGTRRCDYVKSLAEDLQANAEAMVQAWSHDGDDYLGALVASGEPGAPFMSAREASNEIVNRMLFLVENMMRLKLGKPLGLESGGEPQPDEVESPYSDHSIEDILANLDGLENLYRGQFGEARGIGVQRWVRWYNPEVDRRVIASMLEARWAVQDIPEPLSRAVLEHGDAVQAAYDQMRELRNTIGVDLINALAGSVTFNDTDGD